MNYLLAGFLALFLSGCVSMPMDQCKYLDWHTAGRESAKSGDEGASLNALKQMCGQQGIVVDEKAFREGRMEGLRDLCSYKGGFELGVEGKTYSGACPADQSEEFIRGFREGAREYREQQAAKTEERRDTEELERMRRRRLKREAPRGDYGKSCTFDSECELRDTCDEGKCGGNGKSCNFDSDCSIQGRCEQGPSLNPGDTSSARSCHYN